MLKQNRKETGTIISFLGNNALIKISINVFTVYVGLVASGYEFSYDKELSEKIRNVKWDSAAVEYFRKARTLYCDVNPYWPRASMLVSASLFLNESDEIEYTDYKKFKEKTDNLSNIDPKEKEEDTKLWLLQLPTYYSLIRKNEEFNDLWVHYVKKIESDTPYFMEIINEAKRRVISKFKITESELPDMELIPNILGMLHNADFERIDDIIYVVSAQPDILTIVHEYLHNILGHGIKDNIKSIENYVHLLNPVFDRMLSYKYAWGKDTQSWARVFEENLIRAATIWVNEPDESKAIQQSIKQENGGFAYVPVLLDQFNNNWCGINGISMFIDCCLKACEQRCNAGRINMS